MEILKNKWRVQDFFIFKSSIEVMISMKLHDPNVSSNQFTQAQKHFCTKDAISYGHVWKNLGYSDNSTDWR